MSGLPAGWSQVRLGDICQIVSGATPRTDTAEYWGGDTPWLTPDDLSRHSGKHIGEGRRFLTQAGYDSCSTRLVPAGSVLYSSRAPIGYAAIATRPLCTNQGFKTAVPGPELQTDFLYWQLLALTDDIRNRASGTTFLEISGKAFGATEIVVPPLDEQQRIVAVLEDNLSRLEAAQDYMQSAAKRSTTMASAHVVASMLGGQADMAGARDAVAADDGALPLLPDGWHWQPLGDLCDVVGGVTKDAGKQHAADSVEVPYLRVANVQRGRLDLTVMKSIRVPATKAVALRLVPGDVLLNEGGDRDKLGRGWVWSGELDECIHQNHVFRARVRDDAIRPKLLSYWANTVGGQWCERHGRQSVNLASISLKRIRDMPVPVPPVEEQEALELAIATSQEGADRLASAGRALTTRSAVLRGQLLTAAFAGRLPSNDQP